MFKTFLEEGNVKECPLDNQKIKSLILMSESIIKSFEKIPLDDLNASLTVTNHYEALRLILECVGIKKGYSFFSHEAYYYFVLEILKDQRIAENFDKYRKVRNKINYYGKTVSKEFACEAKENMLLLINDIKKKFL
ncbi:MAG: hypothetical protein WC755_01105 [Candidatus Woesearchaeota archaeon]|jgi:hypothetical protein